MPHRGVGHVRRALVFDRIDNQGGFEDPAQNDIRRRGATVLRSPSWIRHSDKDR